MENKEKISFIEGKKLQKTLEKELETTTQESAAQNHAATNPIAGAFLKFVHFKNKFTIKDI